MLKEFGMEAILNLKTPKEIQIISNIIVISLIYGTLI